MTIKTLKSLTFYGLFHSFLQLDLRIECVKMYKVSKMSDDTLVISEKL